MSDVDETGAEGSETVEQTLAVTQETITYAVYRSKPSEKNPDISKLPLGFGILKDGNDLYKSIYGYKDAKGNDVVPDTDLLRTATVTQPVVHTAEGITQVITDSDEAASIFMQGANQKLKSQLRSKLTAVNETSGDFESPQDTISYEECVEILSTPLQRRNLTETQKAMKAVKTFSPDVLAAVLKQMGYAV
ncbi:MAG TPA: hypothetical protein VGF75_08245 [Candidatus Saccharimonadales bacterium]|jgi:hypothetical protein